VSEILPLLVAAELPPFDRPRTVDDQPTQVHMVMPVGNNKTVTEQPFSHWAETGLAINSSYPGKTVDFLVSRPYPSIPAPCTYFMPGTLGEDRIDQPMFDMEILRYHHKVDLIMHWIGGEVGERIMIEGIFCGKYDSLVAYHNYLTASHRYAEADVIAGWVGKARKYPQKLRKKTDIGMSYVPCPRSWRQRFWDWFYGRDRH
jgi:hypothetical protein